MDLRIRQYLSKAQERRDAVYLRKAYDLIGAPGPAASDGRSQSELSVLCAEQSLQLGYLEMAQDCLMMFWERKAPVNQFLCRAHLCQGQIISSRSINTALGYLEMAQDCLMMFWERKAPVNQFLCRAHLCQGQIISSRSINTAEDMEKAVMCFLNAIEIAKDKSRYHFLVFNASLLYFQCVRRFLRPGQRQLLVPSLTQVLKALEEVQDPDHSWRAELMLHLVECLLDAGKRTEAADMAKVTSEFIGSHKPELYPRLFSIQVRHNLIDVSEMLKDENPKLLAIYKIQKLKHMIDASDVKRDDATGALKEIFLLLIQSSELRASVIQDSTTPPVSHSSSAPSISRRGSAPPPIISPGGSAPPPILGPRGSAPPPVDPPPIFSPGGSAPPPILSPRGSAPPSVDPPPVVSPGGSAPPPVNPPPIFSPGVSSSPPIISPRGSAPPPVDLPPIVSPGGSAPPPVNPPPIFSPGVSSSPPIISPRGSAPPPVDLPPIVSPGGSAPPPVNPPPIFSPGVSSSPPIINPRESAPPVDPPPIISPGGSAPPPIISPRASAPSPVDPQLAVSPRGSSAPPVDHPPVVTTEGSSPPPISRNAPPNLLSSRPVSSSRSSSLDHSSSIPLSDRVELLLELAFLSLQLQQLQTAVDCLKELRDTHEVTVGQRVLLECVQCELDLHTRTHRMEKYSRSAVELQLSVVVRLDALLQKAMKEGDARVVQAVCVCQWNTCLPLLQHNLRKRVRKPLITLTRALENTHSVLLDVLCCAHAELAAVDEEEERLQSAVDHLQRAVDLDPQSERLSSRLRLLRLRCSPIYNTPAGAEDRAHTLILQAGEGKGRELLKKCRPLLVQAGLALAADAFQSVLDADRRVTGAGAQDGLPLLAAKAQHHFSCVQKVEEHLAGLDNSSDHTHRVRLWAALAKTARKQEVFDVCRAACRFCLLYDDGRWENTGEQKSRASPDQREVLRLLAEVHFINAEVTILKLRSEGVELNGSAVSPDKRQTRPPEDDAHWNLYSDWIKGLSSYATGQFLRGAELGAGLGEAWLVVNAAVYLWNYNSGLLSAGEHRLLLPTFSRMVELLQHTGHAGEVVLLVQLCDAVAQGLIQPWCESVRVHQESQSALKAAVQPAAEKTRKARGKSVEKPGGSVGPQLDAAALQDIRRALEVCEFALKLSNGNTDPVPIMVRKKLFSSWVSIRQLLQQQIGLKLDIKDESENEAVSSMSRVLVAVEMLQCNRNSRLMEFTVPALSALVEMASGCEWSDPAVQLYVWTQLALFAHQTRDHDLVLTCSHNALLLERSAAHRVKTDSSALWSVCSLQEMLSSAACVRGQSLIHEARAHQSTYTEGLHSLLYAVRWAEQAGCWTLCLSAAGHYWNACMPLLDTRQDRRQLREPLELILKAITRKHTHGKIKKASGLEHGGRGMETSETTTDSSGDALKLWTSVLNALLSVHADSGDWRKGLQLLDETLRETADPGYHRLVCEQRVELKARLGECVLLDVQRFGDEDEIFSSRMWRRAALCAEDPQQRLTYYQNSITALKSSAVELQKVDVQLEFSEWLYFSHCDVSVVRLQVEQAVDLLLSDTEAATVCAVSRLERLLRAHTLLALTEPHSSPKHQQDLLSAYNFCLLIWKVSFESAEEVMKRSAAGQTGRSSSSTKDKDDKKTKPPSPVEDRPEGQAPAVCVPVSVDQWAQFVCPEELRQVFRSDSSPYSINSSSFSQQSRTLFYLDLLVRELDSISLTPLTFAPLHLAEVIAHDLMESRSHSDLYRLRIIRSGADLGSESSSPYSEHLLSFTRVPEDELMRIQRAVASERSRPDSEVSGSDVKLTHSDRQTLPAHGHTLTAVWLLKADVCLSMKLFQPAQVLLKHSQRTSEELGDHTSLAKSLLLLAVLANEERRHNDALLLLQEAQEIGGDEEFIFLTAQTLMTAVVELDKQNQLETHQQVCEITEQACRTLRAVLDQRPNRASVLRFYMASLEFRGAVFRLHLLRTEHPPAEMLTSVCETLKHASEELLQLGYKTDSAKATLQHANTLRLLSARAVCSEEKQQHLLQAFSLMKTAVSIQEELFASVQKLLPHHQLDLPAARVCVRLRLALSNLALFMLDIQCSEQTRKSMIRDRKCSVERVVEDYLRSSSELSQQQREWSSVGRCLAQVVLTNLAAVHSLSRDCVETRARALGLMGRCLRLVAQQRDPLYPSTLWNEPVTDEHKTGREDNEDQQMKMTETRIKQYEDKRAKLQSDRRAAQHLLAQASESLSQSVSLSLQHNLPHLLPDVCADLLECHGQCDPSTSGQYLALLQSGVCCVELSSVLHQVSSSVSECQAFALMNLREKLISSRGHRAAGLQTAVSRELESLSTAFSQLTINPKHLGILGEMPVNFRILLLQHSEERSVLYGGFYEKLIEATETQKGKTVTGGLICTKVVKASVDRSSLLQLHKHLLEFKDLNKQTLLKESRRKTHESNDGKLDDRFRALLEDMENYLQPVLSQLDFSCFSVRSPSIISTATSARARDKEEKTADKPQPDAGECVVILADQMLLEFPLEALSVLQANGISSISRDFSLQVLHSRLQTDHTVESDNKKEARGVRGVKGRGDQSHAIKAGLVSRVPPPNTVPLDTHRLRYVVDVQEEDDGKQTEWTSPAEIMRNIITNTSQFTARWEGLMGNEHTRSVSDLEQLLMSCSAFIYSSMKSFFSCFPPARMATLRMSGCLMVLLFDCGQNRDGVQKRRCVVSVDTALGSVYLLTLSGARSVLLNQWHSSTAANTVNMSVILNHLLDGGLTSGRAAHALRTHRSEKAEISGKSSSLTAVNVDDGPSEDPPRTTHRSADFNFVIYGLPNVLLT